MFEKRRKQLRKSERRNQLQKASSETGCKRSFGSSGGAVAEEAITEETPEAPAITEGPVAPTTEVAPEAPEVPGIEKFEKWVELQKKQAQKKKPSDLLGGNLEQERMFRDHYPMCSFNG